MRDAEAFLYFAYGSNLGRRRLCARTPSAKFVDIGFVRGRRLVFDKVGKDGSGKCDCELSADPSDRVWGALYLIAQTDRPALDRAEGLGHGYEARMANVETDIDCRKALTYMATKKAAGLQPYSWYKHHVVVGAEEVNLPSEYVDALRLIEGIEDPDEEQHFREMAIYRQP